MRRGRTLLRGRRDAGLARLAGGVGQGFERAGMQLASLGNTYQKQDNYDDEAKIKAADKTAANKEKKAMISANATNNAIVNPERATAFKAAYKGEGDAGDALGRVTLAAPVSKGHKVVNNRLINLDTGEVQNYSDPKSKKVSKTIVDDQNKVHILYSDGSREATNLTSKDWSASKGNKSGVKVPEGYKFAGEFDVDDTLDYELAVSGAYFTDEKSGKRYVNVAKYNRLMNLGNTEIK